MKEVIILAVIALLTAGCSVQPEQSAQTTQETRSKQISKAEWRSVAFEKWGLGGSADSFSIIGAERAEFVSTMGEPDRTQNMGGNTYWYYNCRDGIIQMDISIQGSLLYADINDF